MNRPTLLTYLGKSPLNYTILNASSYSGVYSVKKKKSLLNIVFYLEYKLCI